MMQHVPQQLATDLERLRDDTRAIPPANGRFRVADVEELIAKAIHLYQRLDRQHERWAEPIRQGRATFDLAEGKAWQTTFQNWCDDARQIIKQAKELQAAGQQVDQFDQLFNTLLHCEYDGIDIEDLARGAEELRAGKGIPMAEIENELRRRLEAEGKR
jgi:hypothetical protein